MNTYKPEAYRTQAAIRYAVTRDECAEVPPCSIAEYNQLLSRHEETTGDDEMDFYCRAYLFENISADALWEEMKANRVLERKEEFLRAYATGVAVLTAEREGWSLRLPERGGEAA